MKWLGLENPEILIFLGNWFKKNLSCFRSYMDIYVLFKESNF